MLPRRRGGCQRAHHWELLVSVTVAGLLVEKSQRFPRLLRGGRHVTLLARCIGLADQRTSVLHPRRLDILVTAGRLDILVATRGLDVLVATRRLDILIATRGLDILVATRRLDVLGLAARL
jgi:hypothetical protein